MHMILHWPKILYGILLEKIYTTHSPANYNSFSLFHYFVDNFNSGVTTNTLILTHFQKWIGLVLTTIVKSKRLYL